MNDAALALFDPPAKVVIKFRNKSALDKFVRHHDGAPDEALVKAINMKLVSAMLAHNTSVNDRLDAARMLVELRTRKEADGEDWWKWQRGKFDRTRKDMEKLLAIGRADDPEAAAEAERERTRTQVAKHRETQTEVTAYVSGDPETNETTDATNAQSVEVASAEYRVEPITATARASDRVDRAFELLHAFTDHERAEFIERARKETLWLSLAVSE